MSKYLGWKSCSKNLTAIIGGNITPKLFFSIKIFQRFRLQMFEQHCLKKTWKNSQGNITCPYISFWNSYTYTYVKLNNLSLSLIFNLDQLSALCARFLFSILLKLFLFAKFSFSSTQETLRRHYNVTFPRS